jgi:hypothetical protein
MPAAKPPANPPVGQSVPSAKPSARRPLPEDESRACTVYSTVTSVSGNCITLDSIPYPYPKKRRFAPFPSFLIWEVSPELLASAYRGAPIEIRLRFRAPKGKIRRRWTAEIIRIGFDRHEDLFTSGDDSYEVIP